MSLFLRRREGSGIVVEEMELQTAIRIYQIAVWLSSKSF
jgi:hypothetical protein